MKEIYKKIPLKTDIRESVETLLKTFFNENFEWIVIKKLQRVARVVASFLLIFFLLNYTVGELVGMMVTLRMNTVASKVY